MPPWVARQCHVWRAPHSVPGAWSVSTAQSRLPRAFLARSYSQSSNGDDLRRLNTANSAIIIPRSVHAQPDDLIAHIQPVDHARLNRDRFAVFFVTPAFAPWLLDDHIFLRKALRQAYAHELDSEESPYGRLHALCAVVDKLPTPKAIADRGKVGNEASQRMIQPPFLQDGYEGIAYTTLRFDDSIPASAPAAVDEKAAITFTTSVHADITGHFGDSLQLPLANTVFQTGSPSTMTYSTWSKRKGANEFELEEKRNVTQHGIRLHRSGTSQQYISALAVPLLPLTDPRCVEASMGNILRRIVGPNGESVTASQELERVVPRYHEARGEMSQATSVWALIIPKELMIPVSHKTNALLKRPSDVDSTSAGEDKARWYAFWKKPVIWNDLIPKALASGARLHRVLSGGGGWGKKAGLLSLDPVATTADAGSFSPGTSQEPTDLSSALQSVAHDGDYIQFFVSRSNPWQKPPGPDSLSYELESLEKLTKVDSTWGWELGTVPSTMDSIPGGSWQHSAPASKGAFAFKHTFGALAEGGITLHRQFRLTPEDAFWTISGSKLDVPYSRYSAVSIGPDEEDAEDISMESLLEAKRLPYHNVLVRRLYDGKDAPDFLGIGRARLLNPSRRQRSSRRVEYAPIRPFAGLMFKGVREVLGKTDKIIRDDNAPVRQVPSKSIRKWNTRFRLEDRDPSLVIREVLVARSEDPAQLTEEPEVVLRKFRVVGSEAERLRQEALFAMRMMKASEKAIRRVPSRGDNLLVIRKIIRDAFAIEAQLDRLQDDILNTFLEASQSVFDHLLHRLDEITSATTQLRAEFARILDSIVVRARLTHATNSSAVEIYSLHVSLRKTLGHMVRTHQQQSHLHLSDLSILQSLEHTLVTLRLYKIDLFYDREQTSTAYISQRLADIEMLPDTAQWRDEVAALRSEQPPDIDARSHLGRRKLSRFRLLSSEAQSTMIESLQIRYYESMHKEVPQVSASPTILWRRRSKMGAQRATSSPPTSPTLPLRHFESVGNLTQKKRQTKAELVNTVLGWLKGGEGDSDSDAHIYAEGERVFGQRAAMRNRLFGEDVSLVDLYEDDGPAEFVPGRNGAGPFVVPKVDDDGLI